MKLEMTFKCPARSSITAAAFLLGTFFLAAPACAQKIDFETLPDGSPTSGGMVISNQYSQAYGVSFRFQDGTYPVIRKVGGFNSNTGRPTAFWGYPNSTGYNTPAPGQNVGTNFLSDDANVGDPPAPLIVTYSQPVSAASGFILDIDAEEAWDVYARNASNQTVAQVHLGHGAPNTGDGIATPWSFTRATADIASIRIVFSGTDPSAIVGLAFDNFSPATNLTIPGPAALSINVASNKVSLGITGTPSAVYAIEGTTALGSSNWSHMTSVVLPGPSFTLTNIDSTTATAQRFYRAVGVQ